MAAPRTEWIFRASLVRVVDGDTVDLDVDLGFRARMTLRFRVAGIDTPEITGPTRTLGLLASARTAAFLARGGIEVTSRGEADKYGGRWDADIRALGVDLAETLVREGYALRWDGSGVRPHWDIAAAYPLAA